MGIIRNRFGLPVFNKLDTARELKMVGNKKQKYELVSKKLREIPAAKISDFLESVLDNPTAPIRDRLNAARLIMDRRDGLLTHNLILHTANGEQLPDLSKLSDEKLKLLESTLSSAIDKSEIEDAEIVSETDPDLISVRK